MYTFVYFFRYIIDPMTLDHAYCKHHSHTENRVNRNTALPQPSFIHVEEKQSISYYAVEQRSKEWKSLRAGKVAASAVSELIGLMLQEKMSSAWDSVFKSTVPYCKNFLNFQRGIEYEEEARRKFTTDSGSHSMKNLINFFSKII